MPTCAALRRYVGPDTLASHVSAATGTRTITLFGPTNPVRWGPWPKGWVSASPWTASGSGHQRKCLCAAGNWRLRSLQS
ncbi:glycosyltransferase family 9 protein [Paraburkholderia fungorum]|uniref:glycosyltransferase family 9 protein n=1 Tax=Paraburkholderia fungorum TaxID=134537 RepID=UPI003877CF3C